MSTYPIPYNPPFRSHLRWIAVLYVFLTICFYSIPTRAQLISPGKLSKAHESLEGITNCTSCHELGKRGISNIRCLDCHKPLKQRIDLKLGYHASLDVVGKNCANCHKEHLGATFKLVDWDTTNFDHRKTGFALIGKHMKVACGSCHKPAFVTNPLVRSFKSKYHALPTTFLGLSTKCEPCHKIDNPHGLQFAGKDCGSCHTPYSWKDSLSFNHSKTRFALMGKHLQVKCSDCHKKIAGPNGKPMVKYAGLAFSSCVDCHKDVHKGTMGTNCQSCHSVKGWHIFKKKIKGSTFNHAETGFPLVGHHAKISCSSCHDPNKLPGGISIKFAVASLSSTYPYTKVKDCQSCHIDYHKGVFAGSKFGTNCKNCHTQTNWNPSTFDIASHANISFELTGAHAAVPCYSCHRHNENPTGALHFRFAGTKCIDCHADDNPHGIVKVGTKTLKCTDCHTTNSWDDQKSMVFNHTTTGFKLTGRHAAITCTSCHKPATDQKKQILFAGLSKDCKSCHTKDSPHHGQFASSKMGAECSNCHDTQSFVLASFDHNRTSFPLTGAHAKVSCSDCHKQVTAPDGSKFVRYTPLSTKCESCHAKK